MSKKTNSLDFERAIKDIKKNNKLAIAVGGFAALIVGLFLPWYEATVFGARISSAPELNSTGFLILVAAVVGGGAAMNILNKEAKQMRTVAIVAAGFAALIVLTNYPDSDLGSLVSVGIGYWISLAGVAAALYGILTDK